MFGSIQIGVDVVDLSLFRSGGGREYYVYRGSGD